MSQSEKYRRYAKLIDIFDGLSPTDARYVLRQGKTDYMQAGQVIFHEGMLDDHLFIVFGGRVALRCRGKLIEILEKGDSFGTSNILTRKPAPVTAIAETEVKLFILTERELLALLQDFSTSFLLANMLLSLSNNPETLKVLISQLPKEYKSVLEQESVFSRVSRASRASRVEERIRARALQSASLTRTEPDKMS